MNLVQACVGGCEVRRIVIDRWIDAMIYFMLELRSA